MKFNFLLIALGCFTHVLFSQSPFIHVDQFGYYPNAEKVAVLSNPQEGYNSDDSYTPGSTLEVRESGSNNVVFTGSPSPWNNGSTHDQSGDQGWWFDFSNVMVEGTYHIFDPSRNAKSADFEINADIYRDILVASGRMFFYNRCNFTKDASNVGVYADGMSFMNNQQDGNARFIFAQGDASLEKELSGGWFDAGDYNKYVTFATGAVHDMLWAYRDFPQAFGDDWNIAESGNGIADILDEVKWELEWLLKMNNPDGTTHNKLGSRNYSENVASPPSANTDPRFYGNTCTSASIAVAGMFAHAAKVFANVPGMDDFVDSLQISAIRSWDFVLPALESYYLEVDCDDGSIVAGDADWNFDFQREQALASAAYLFELTGNENYNTYLSTYAYSDSEALETGFWGPYKMAINDALLNYSILPNANAALASAISTSFSDAVNNNWNGFYGFNDADLYRAYMPDWSYSWGSNNPKAAYGTMNYLAEKYNVDANKNADFLKKRYNQLHYFHGINPLGIVYLSNMGDYGAERSCNEIYHGWFAPGTDYDNAQTSAHGPAPGYIPGGPNGYFTVTSLTPPYGQPFQKSYLDFNDGWPLNSWEITEPAIYYQASFLRLIAGIVSEGDVSPPPPPPGCSNVDYAEDDFENGFGNWIDGGRNCRRVSSRANSGAYSIMLSSRSWNATTYTNPIDFSDYESLEIEFSFMTENFLNSTHDIWVQLSLDGGQNFETILDLNFGEDFQNNVYQTTSIEYDGPFTNNMVIKFRNHAADRRDRLFLDDIK
ncbi:MAG: glycoside hydrolase family 9 protein, partial [Bacteroidota bacterium]